MYHHDDDADDRAAASELTSRRQIMKKAAIGAAAAGVVWSAPKVEGLSIRPNYAAAASGGGGINFIDQTTVTLRFNATTAGATAQLANGFIGASGNWLSNCSTHLKINTFNQNPGSFTSTVEITGMSFGANVAAGTLLKGGAAVVFPTNADAPFDVTLANTGPCDARPAPPHTWTTTFRCT